jgi:hypothetical protein
MGIIKHLLFWPVTGPSFLARFSLEKVSDTVREELTSDDAIKEDLLALQMRLELGDIDDDQYLAEEAALMQRLRDVRHWREQYGMGVSGGPVQVGKQDEPDPKDSVEPVVDEAAPDRGIATPEGASVEIRFDWE